MSMPIHFLFALCASTIAVPHPAVFRLESAIKEFVESYDTLSIPYTYCSSEGGGVRCIGEGEEEGNELLGENDEDIYDDYFEKFWQSAPDRNGKKVNKDEARKKFSTIKKDDLPLVVQAVKNYANSKNVKDGIGIKDPHRFISNKENKKYWREWIDPEKIFGLKHDNDSPSYHGPVKGV